MRDEDEGNAILQRTTLSVLVHVGFSCLSSLALSPPPTTPHRHFSALRGQSLWRGDEMRRVWQKRLHTLDGVYLRKHLHLILHCVCNSRMVQSVVGASIRPRRQRRSGVEWSDSSDRGPVVEGLGGGRTAVGKGEGGDSLTRPRGRSACELIR